jgi:acetone carboxylase gamma subunit
MLLVICRNLNISSVDWGRMLDMMDVYKYSYRFIKYKFIFIPKEVPINDPVIGNTELTFAMLRLYP